LAQADRPLDAKHIHRLLDGAASDEPEVSLPTVYRTLAALEKAQLIEAIPGRAGGLHYRLVPASSAGEVVCQRCGRVEDLNDTPELAAFKENVARDSSFAAADDIRIYTGCRRSDCD
ncbi:MAG: transcriptional repressor, partial [Betaproteobacteria bacterium]|nr:transcriptional repressor [Betaproteobacteria bacterium]